MTQEALRTADGEPVFVKDNGEYAREFPQESVVRRADTDNVGYIVYGFVGSHGDYEEEAFGLESEEEARKVATEIYGKENVEGFERDGEVFEVEVHEVPHAEAVPYMNAHTLI